MWNAKIAEMIAPKIPESVDLQEPVAVGAGGEEDGGRKRRARKDRKSRRSVKEYDKCIKCGATVSQGTVVCWKCQRGSGRFWDNCSGPSLLFLSATVGIVTLIVRAVT